jgi:hypothetical protein
MSDIQQLNNMARRLLEAEQEVEKIEQQLKGAKERMRLLVEVEIPELMDDLGLAHGTRLMTPYGELSLNETIRARINESDKEAAYGWLTEHGEGSLIKNQLTLDFPRGEDEKALELRLKLEEELGRCVSQSRTIHHQTLSAWVRARLEEGLDVPPSITYYEQKTVKLR